MKKILPLLFLLGHLSIYSQGQISGTKHFKKFLKNNEDKSLLIIGENHASAVGSIIFPDLVKFLHKKTGLRTLLIEFGPSEAYFYTRYLQTGDEKHLNYTIYAGAYEGWREGWRELYKYNKTLDQPLKVIGIDFDRTRTLAYALYSIFSKYKDSPKFVEVLMNEIKTDDFYNTYTIGYPTELDKAWTAKTKLLLKSNYWELKSLLNEEHLEVLDKILYNTGIGYGGRREESLAKSTERAISISDQKDFIMIIGRSHAYIHPIYGDEEPLAMKLIKETKIKVLTGVILFQNSILLGGKDRKDRITLFEIENKIPWKRFFPILNKNSNSPIGVIKLKGELCSLAYYTDYVILARNQEPYQLLNSSQE